MAATEVRIVAAVDDGLETVRESSRPESSQSDDDEGGEQGPEPGIERGLVRWKQAMRTSVRALLSSCVVARLCERSDGCCTASFNLTLGR